MASPPQDVVTTARCSEITAARNTALASTPDIDVQRTPHCNVSQQAGYDEDIPIEHCMTTTKRNSQRTGDKPDDIMNNESHNEFSNANIIDNIDTDQTRNAFYTARTLSPQVIDRKTFVEEGRECASAASTSPSSLIDAKCNKNQRNKVRYKYACRRYRHQNCWRARTLPRKRQKEPVKHRRYNYMIQQIYESIKEIFASCQSSAKEGRRDRNNKKAPASKVD